MPVRTDRTDGRQGLRCLAIAPLLVINRRTESGRFCEEKRPLREQLDASSPVRMQPQLSDRNSDCNSNRKYKTPHQLLFKIKTKEWPSPHLQSKIPSFHHSIILHPPVQPGLSQAGRRISETSPAKHALLTFPIPQLLDPATPYGGPERGPSQGPSSTGS